MKDCLDIIHDTHITNICMGLLIWNGYTMTKCTIVHAGLKILTNKQFTKHMNKTLTGDLEKNLVKRSFFIINYNCKITNF